MYSKETIKSLLNDVDAKEILEVIQTSYAMQGILEELILNEPDFLEEVIRVILKADIDTTIKDYLRFKLTGAL